MIILGIDPGTARVGWGIVREEKGKVTADNFGCIETKPHQELAIRLKEIYDKIMILIQQEKPNALAIEEIYFTNNAKTVISVAQSRGIVLLAAAQTATPVISYTPLVVKQTITGNGRADKSQVQFMITKLLHLSSQPTLDDTSDALAIALTHAYSYRMNNQLR